MDTRRDTGTRRALDRQPTRVASRGLLGGATGNRRLTSLLGVILLLLLAAEGATIPWIRPLLSVHIFLGMLLLGPVAVKLGSTGYRFARYYLDGYEYVKQGPPTPLMRAVVAPILVLSTLVLFGTGVTLLASPHRGAMLGLHKASFIVWFGAMSIHVLAYALRAVRHVLEEMLGPRLGGERVRLLVLALGLVAGVVIAIATYPLAHPWLHGHFS